MSVNLGPIKDRCSHSGCIKASSRRVFCPGCGSMFRREDDAMPVWGVLHSIAILLLAVAGVLLTGLHAGWLK